MMRKTMVASMLLLGATPLFAAECAVEIHGNDAMQFDKASIEVPSSCKEFTVMLKHTGAMAKTVMGHNWVLTKAADMQAVATDGMSAGIEAAYVKADDARVIAHTSVVGGGESTSVTFAVAKLTAGEAYEFFCSFPGHWAMMKGTLAVK